MTDYSIALLYTNGIMNIQHPYKWFLAESTRNKPLLVQKRSTFNPIFYRGTYAFNYLTREYGPCNVTDHIGSYRIKTLGTTHRRWKFITTAGFYE